MAAQGGLYHWLDERYGVSKVMEFARHKTVPVHRGSVWYYFGGLTLFFFIVQVASGIMLLLYYRVGVDSSYESVRFITTKVPFGWLIRSIHSWGANLMVFTALIHMFSVFFERAYTRPRELTWISGMLLLILGMGFGFSGYLLPWNQLALFATKVGTEIVGVIPWAGHFLLRTLRGSEDVTGATLSRFFALHIAIMPAAFTVVLSIHLAFIQVQGMSDPHKTPRMPRAPMPFFPNFLLRDLLLWLLALNVLALLAVFFPWEIGVKADPFSAAPAGIKPEWYFLATYQMLKFIPAKVLGIEGELFGVLVVSILLLFWLLLPFWAGRLSQERRGLMIGIGVLAVVGFTTMTILGWRMP